LPDQRIAWSFLELGVVVAPFIESGQVEANGRLYGVEHLYGIRPFPDDKSMRELQAEIERRVAPWIDDATAYCELKPPRGVWCLSCLGFVMRILFPGKTPEYPALPGDFNRAPDTYYTTEDLLLYLAGLHGVASQEARRKRIDELTIPPRMREELLRIVNAANPSDVTAIGETANTASSQNRSESGSPSKPAPQRLRPTRRL
jgi:hypothetical protein